MLSSRWRHVATSSTPQPPDSNATSTPSPPPPHPSYSVGPDTAATLLTALGDNPARIGSDAAFAKLCGVSPLEASSGKTIRHRLNWGGNRDANRALHVILVVRMRRHQPTRDYFVHRLAEGKTKNGIMRCIKRTSPARSTTPSANPAEEPTNSLPEELIA
ncbi:IS110 family transposase [Mycolicibacterium brumae]|uniref:IS110 family transposase n=1 Tax=Mycolicibacterium brumae TaxID=85968 RepID=UPI0027E2667F|nr:IS110 family transposase [Mycolicibacterium brumae]